MSATIIQLNKYSAVRTRMRFVLRAKVNKLLAHMLSLMGCLDPRFRVIKLVGHKSLCSRKSLKYTMSQINSQKTHPVQ